MCSVRLMSLLLQFSILDGMHLGRFPVLLHNMYEQTIHTTFMLINLFDWLTFVSKLI